MIDEATQARFWRKVDKQAPGGCWRWTGHCNSNGYGQIWLAVDDPKVTHRARQAHRISCEIAWGRAPGPCLDHLCRNRWCVNPAHLQEVNNRTNVLRGIGPTARNAVKTHCPKGHEYTSENTALSSRRDGSTSRTCLICRRARETVTRARRRTAEVEAMREACAGVCAGYKAHCDAIAAKRLTSNDSPDVAIASSLAAEHLERLIRALSIPSTAAGEASEGVAMKATRAVADAMLNGTEEGDPGDYGWNITKLNKARPLIRAALGEEG